MKPVEFNKKNAIKFANKIYNDKTYMILCEGSLEDKDKMRCILGEASLTFLGKIPSNILEAVEQLLYKAKIDYDLLTNPVVKLFEVGKSELRAYLENALDRLYEINDDARGYKTRAKACKKAWMETIVPLLK